MEQLNFNDFYQVPDLKFDINRLRKDLETWNNDADIEIIR